MRNKKLVVLSGAGISAESGIKTFRDADGLWEGHDVMEVASPEGWQKNKALVLDFYNQRRKQLLTVSPNKGHNALAADIPGLETEIITQNVDDLHERAGSKQVTHLHGELLKVRSTGNPSLVYSWEKDIEIGDCCEENHQLRPHIVWFGEAVPMLDKAIDIVQQADFVIVVGTSLQVYPAAGLLHYAPNHAPLFYVDPKPASVSHPSIKVIAEKASTGIPKALNKIKTLL
ncbi:MAG: NAD-dependent deacylase [Flavobacteriaceae bacterium]|nr:NAD-dependent deacylase [Flavobacteriaceae bacterium]